VSRGSAANGARNKSETQPQQPLAGTNSTQQESGVREGGLQQSAPNNSSHCGELEQNQTNSPVSFFQ